jgi:putative NIF3 family GTP cyclohydrolase 1 type 2
VEAKDQAQLNVAIPQSVSPTDRWSLPITSVGICAGSGGSILNGVDVDMLFTGELSHHEALAAIEQGRVVVTTFHSNSERAYLDLNFRPHLEKEIQGVIDDPEFKAEFEGLWNISQSKADRDPYVSVHEDDLLEHESK